MEFFLIALALSTVSAGVTTAVTARSKKGQTIVKLRPQTKAESFLEQTELGKWLTQDAKELTAKISTEIAHAAPAQISFEDRVKHKEEVILLLQKFRWLFEGAPLSNLSKYELRKCVEAAEIAVQVTDIVDQKLMKLITLMIGRGVEAIILTAGMKANVVQVMEFMRSFSGISNAFRQYTSGTAYQLNSGGNNH